MAASKTPRAAHTYRGARRNATRSIEDRKQIDSLQEEVIEWKDKLTAEQGRRYAAEEQSRKSMAYAEEKASQFNDLKKRLHDSELECSRLKGYMERVREDDNVADPLVEVEDGNGKRHVSKRWPSNGMNNVYGSTDLSSNGEYVSGPYSERKKREHWITY